MESEWIDKYYRKRQRKKLIKKLPVLSAGGSPAILSSTYRQ
jgi:hypothetical protein